MATASPRETSTRKAPTCEPSKKRLLVSPLTQDVFNRASKSLQNVAKKHFNSPSTTRNNINSDSGPSLTPQRLSNSLSAIKKGAISSFNSLTKSTISNKQPTVTKTSPLRPVIKLPKRVNDIQSKRLLKPAVSEEGKAIELQSRAKDDVLTKSVDYKVQPEVKQNQNPENLQLHVADVHCSSGSTIDTVNAVISPPHAHTRSSDILAQRRSTPGRSNQREIKSDSELYSKAHVQCVLRVIRKKISPEEKLLAIKRNREFWEKVPKGAVIPTAILDKLPSQFAKCTATMSESVQSSLATPVVLEVDEEPMDTSETAFNEFKDKGSDKLPKDSLTSSDNITLNLNVHLDDSSKIAEPVAQNISTSSEPNATTLNRPLKCESEDPKIYVGLEQVKVDQAIHKVRAPKLSESNQKRSILPSTSDFTDEVFNENLEENIVHPSKRIVLKSPSRPKQGHIRRSQPCLLEVEVNVPEDPSSPYPKPPKSPITVQEWVNSIDLDENERQEEAVLGPSQCSVSHDSGYQSHHETHNIHDSLSEDNLNLGAEARNIDGLRNSAVQSAQKRKSSLSPGRVNLADFRSKQSSFNSEASTLSTVSSLSSVESLLEARREDPEEILLALGFGGSPALDPLARIPQRFLSQPSSARGVNLDSFLKQQEEDFQKQECSCLGYRGLTVSVDVQNCMDTCYAEEPICMLCGFNLKAKMTIQPGQLYPVSDSSVQNIDPPAVEENISLPDTHPRISRKRSGARCLEEEEMAQPCCRALVVPEISITNSENKLSTLSKSNELQAGMGWWGRLTDKSELTAVGNASSSCSCSSSDTAVTLSSMSFRKKIIRSSLV